MQDVGVGVHQRDGDIERVNRRLECRSGNRAHIQQIADHDGAADVRKQEIGDREIARPDQLARWRRVELEIAHLSFRSHDGAAKNVVIAGRLRPLLEELAAAEFVLAAADPLDQAARIRGFTKLIEIHDLPERHHRRVFLGV